MAKGAGDGALLGALVGGAAGIPLGSVVCGGALGSCALPAPLMGIAVGVFAGSAAGAALGAEGHGCPLHRGLSLGLLGAGLGAAPGVVLAASRRVVAGGILMPFGEVLGATYLVSHHC